jgi:glutamine synthetase adenylyltransferase
MEELLWSMKQESRVLQELRKEIRGIWDDEAARELTSRYLDPHESEDQQMLAALNQQNDSLDASQAKLGSAETYARQVEEHAEVVAERLKSTEQEVSSAYSYHDIFAHYNSEAHSTFPAVQRLVNQANSACGGGQEATIHPAGSYPEQLQNVETQPQTISTSPERQKPSPPEGWSPGSVERG